MSMNKFWSQTLDVSSRILEQTTKENEAELMLLSDSLALYESAFRILPTGTGEANIARLALLSQGLNTLHTSVYMASIGYYIQALIPLRHVYESWLSFWYLAKFPDQAEKWLTPQVRPPSAKILLDNIDHPSDVDKSKIREFYGELNRFVHVDPVAAISLLHHDSGNTVINIGVRYNPGDFSACAYGISLWIGMMLDAVASFVPDGNTWHTEHEAIADRIVAFIEKYNSDNGGAPIPPAEDEPEAT
jgi:hypothetical protein